ncbi:MAG: cysteine--tRNA ligase [Candidatus Asgardarchaeia archaeon]
MALTVYNYLSRSKEEFVPLSPPNVKMYVCGPTVYDNSHIGHARTYIAFDVIRRYLEFKGFNVKYVMNITDIDDKIIRKANELKVSYAEVSTKYMLSFFEDMKALNVKPASIHPLATAHIPDMIEIIETLIEKGYAYVADGDVYYDVRKFKDYGKLSRQSIEEMKAGARIEPSEKKKFPLDFALWKSAKPNEPSWPSPWGRGRPGWHIECSSMILRHLGPQIDIHGGGQDLIFPHHENEIAQSEAATGKQFVKYWMYTGFLTIKGHKMSKSLGNFITIKEALKKWDAEAIRLFMLSTHYRSPIDFNEDAIITAENTLRRLYITKKNLIQALEDSKESDDISSIEREFLKTLENINNAFMAAMDDDFSTPQALAEFYTFIRELNSKLENIRTRKVLLTAKSFLDTVSDIFGILQHEESAEVDFRKLLELLLNVRNELRKRKLYDLADEIRSKLREMNIEIQDTKEGTRYYFA